MYRTVKAQINLNTFLNVAEHISSSPTVNSKACVRFYRVLICFNSIGIKFQMTTVVHILTKHPLKTSLDVLFHYLISNTVDLDEMAHYGPSHRDPRCLQKCIVIVCSTERIQEHFHETRNISTYIIGLT